VRVVWAQLESPQIRQCLEILPAQRQGSRPVGSLLVLKLVSVQVGVDLVVRRLLPSFCLLRQVLFVSFPRHARRLVQRQSWQGELIVS